MSSEREEWGRGRGEDGERAGSNWAGGRAADGAERGMRDKTDALRRRSGQKAFPAHVQCRTSSAYHQRALRIFLKGVRMSSPPLYQFNHYGRLEGGNDPRGLWKQACHDVLLLVTCLLSAGTEAQRSEE